MADNAVIEVTINGENALPDNIRVKDLAEIMLSVESMILAVIEQDHPEIAREQIVVGLTNIRRGSTGLQFSVTPSNLALPAYVKVANSIHSGDYKPVPVTIIKPAKVIQDLAIKRGYQVDLGTLNGKREVIATIAADTVIEPTQLVSGATTIYGELIRVGGTTPKVFLRLPDGRGLNCAFIGKKKVQRNVARELAPRIYSWVGLQGVAKWSAQDYILKEFSIESITEYQDVSIVSAMSELSKLVGRFFNPIDDVDRFVAEQRSQ